AAAATDVEDALVRLRIGARDQLLRDRRQHDVLHGLPVGPVPPGHAVPERDLVGVTVVTFGGTHHAQFDVVPVLVFLAGAFASGFGALSLRTLPQGSTAFCAEIFPS